ncbi:MAG: response regulator [Candidatus Sulfopaludibacter sp.]|nr:response regulator [Candidatus Sulfopaludibacter sp.]
MSGAPILVVDDAPVNLKLMRLLLTHEGYEVRTAERAEDALQMLSNYRPELILADIQLPGMNGLEMARRVKEDPRTTTIRVVALTASVRQEDRDRAFRAGCEDYISKPIDTSALAARIRQLLDRPAAAPTATEPAPAGNACLSASPEIETLHRRFLEEGATESRRLLDSLSSAFDAARVAWHLHQWAGTGGLGGHPEISLLARKGEEALLAAPQEMSPLRAALTDLLLTFAELSGRASAPIPDYVAGAVAGKRVGLVGFAAERADAMCAVLERVKARPRLFHVSDDPARGAVADCDVVLVHVRAETRESPWLQPGVPIPAAVKLLFTGEQDDLTGLAPQVRARAADFIVGRAEPQEVLMRVAFALSRHDSAAPEPLAAAPLDAPPRPRTAVACPRIVLADDDNIVRSLVGTTLQNYGMSCKSADNGLAALSLIRSEQPHAAVLDVQMPVMDGFEVLAAVRAEKIPSRVILLTSLGQERDILRGFNLGADDYIKKPFNPFELVARLKRLLQ